MSALRLIGSMGNASLDEVDGIASLDANDGGASLDRGRWERFIDTDWRAGLIDNYRSVATFIIIWAVINIKDKGGVFTDSLLQVVRLMRIIRQ